MPVTYPRIVACGDSALSIELSDEIDEDVNARVVALAADLAERPIDAVLETVPTYRSLLVLYDPSIRRAKMLRPELEVRLRAATPGQRAGRRFVVPVVYGGEAGLDLQELAEMKGLSTEEIVTTHANADYRVYMIGFAPGFAYLGGLPEVLHTPRLATPRQRVEAGAIGIGGRQASINSVPGPSGWRYIGRTPWRLFDPSRSEPFLLRAGDRVRFRPIGPEEAGELDAASAAGRTVVGPEPA